MMSDLLPLPPGSWSEGVSGSVGGLLPEAYVSAQSSGQPCGNTGETFLTSQVTHPRRLDWIRIVFNRLYGGIADERAVFNPCSKPVSLERRHLEEVLANKRCLVSEKSDGVRYQLLLSTWPVSLGSGEFAVLVNERFEAHLVKVMASSDYFRGTLIDGELEEMTDPNPSDPTRGTWEAGRARYYRFLGWDATCIAGKPVGTIPDLEKRLSLVERALGRFPLPPPDEAEVYRRASKCGVISAAERATLTFSVKPTPRRLETLVGPETDPRFDPSVDYPQDGLLFSVIDAPVAIGTTENLLKWKAEHTIDLRIPEELDPDRRPGADIVLLMMEHDREIPASDVEFVMPAGLASTPVRLVLDDDRIAEPDWIRQHLGEIWEFKVALMDLTRATIRCEPIRDRSSNKPQPNNRKTVTRTLVNVIEAIDPDEIYDFVRRRLTYSPQ